VLDLRRVVLSHKLSHQPGERRGKHPGGFRVCPTRTLRSSAPYSCPKQGFSATTNARESGTKTGNAEVKPELSPPPRSRVSLQPPTPVTNSRPRMGSEGPPRRGCVLAQTSPRLRAPSPMAGLRGSLAPGAAQRPLGWCLGGELLPTRHRPSMKI